MLVMWYELPGGGRGHFIDGLFARLAVFERRIPAYYSYI